MRSFILFAGFFTAGVYANTVFMNEDAKATMNQKVIGYFNHNSSIWDRGKTTLKATQRTRNYLHSLGVPILSGVGMSKASTKIPNSYFLGDGMADYVVRTSGGAHNMFFTNLQTVVFTGGFLELCLCEAIRDTARNSTYVAGKPVKFYLQSDAIYTYYARNYMDTRLTAGELENFEPIPEIELQEGEVFYPPPSLAFVGYPLSLAMTKMSDKALIKYLTAKVFNLRTDRFCTSQYTNKKQSRNNYMLKDFGIDVVRGGRVHKITSGKKKIRVIIR